MDTAFTFTYNVSMSTCGLISGAGVSAVVFIMVGITMMLLTVQISSVHCLSER